MTETQMCTVDDIIGGEPCLRVAQVVWHPEVHGHPVFLCNFHAEPFWPLPSGDTGKPESQSEEAVDG